MNEATAATSSDEEQSLDTLEERLASTLHLAGEALVPNVTPEPVFPATPIDNQDAPFLEDFGWLKDFRIQLQQLLEAYPQLAELLHQLPKGLGDGENLQVWFRNLFPEQAGKRRFNRDRDGKPLLSPIQIEIMQRVAVGKQNAEIAQELGLKDDYVGSVLQNVNRKLNARSRQEAVATAISMGYLPMDVMDFIGSTAKVGPRNFGEMDTLVSVGGSVEQTSSPLYWQELGAFGLFLMLASGVGVATEESYQRLTGKNGFVTRLERQPDGTYRMREVIEPGLLCSPQCLVIAPPQARKQGFTPGNLFVVHHRSTMHGRNIFEIAEFTPEGRFVRAFCGGVTVMTSLSSGGGATFTPSGALLVTNSKNLLRFTENGTRVQPLSSNCCLDVCTDSKGQIYVTHFSGRGDALEIYSPRGKRLKRFAQLNSATHFYSLKVTSDGSIAALYFEEERSMIQIYDAEGEHLRCWRVPVATRGLMALDPKTQLLYVPCKQTRDIKVYTLEGQLHEEIALNKQVIPRALTFDDGSLWLVGSLSTD